MPFSKLPTECFNNILSFLDNASLYRCLFVNRSYCRITVPIIWSNPFIKKPLITISNSLIKTLIACLEKDDIFSLTPSFYTKPTLFDYGTFVRKINHDHLVQHVRSFVELSSGGDNTNCRVQKIVDAIYYMIIRKSSTLHEFEVNLTHRNFISLPKVSSFINYIPGFRNLRSLTILNLVDDTINQDSIFDNAKLQNITEFLNMVSNSCNYIVNFELWIKPFNCAFTEQYLNIIKLHPLKKILIHLGDSIEKVPVNFGLEFRSDTLKELMLNCIDFKHFDLSFLTKLKYLERLEFLYCKGFNDQQINLFSNNKLHLKEFKLWHSSAGILVEKIINYLCSDLSLLKLTLSNISPKAIKAVKETCPNISFLYVRFHSNLFNDSIISVICELPSLKTLNIESNFGSDMSSEVRNLANNLISVEYLYFDFNVDLSSFIYFTNKCKAKLKKWIITSDNNTSSNSYLFHVIKFQKIHKSLEKFGIKKFGYKPMNEEINILKNQGIDLVASDELDYLFY